MSIVNVKFFILASILLENHILFWGLILCLFSVHQKCSNYALTNKLFGLCRSMWIIDPVIIRPSSHPRVLAHPSTTKVLRAKEHVPTPCPSANFTFGLAIETIQEFRSLEIRKSIGILIPKMGTHLRMCKFIPSHLLDSHLPRLPWAWNVTSSFTLSPHLCKPLPWLWAQN